MRYMRLLIAEQYIVLSMKGSEFEGDELELDTSIGLLSGLACVIWNLPKVPSAKIDCDRKKAFGAVAGTSRSRNFLASPRSFEFQRLLSSIFTRRESAQLLLAARESSLERVLQR